MTRTYLRTDLQTAIRQFDTKPETQTLRLTVRFGAMPAAAVAAFAALDRIAGP